MSEMVFQGTVLGPLLWNIFFKDAGDIIRNFDFKDLIFGDGVNGVRLYPNCVQNHFIETDVRNVHMKLHEWGIANRVSFDASK